MQFTTESQSECYARVARWLADAFDSEPRDDLPYLITDFEGAVAFTGVEPWGEDRAIVITRAYVDQDARLDAEMLYMLMRRNGTLRFGRFGLDNEDELFYEHDLLSTACTEETVTHSVRTVLSVVLEYGDAIASLASDG